MGRSVIEEEIAKRLAPLLPGETDPGKILDGRAAQRFSARWAQLEDMGFELNVGRASVQVRHRGTGFETVIQLSHENDLGEKRALFRALKRAFGRTTDRFFSWIFLPSPPVSLAYESLREIIEICQSVRAKHRFPG
jgi:hypothetical protein